MNEMKKEIKKEQEIENKIKLDGKRKVYNIEVIM